MIIKILPRRTQFCVVFVLSTALALGFYLCTKSSSALADWLTGMEVKTPAAEEGRAPRDAPVSSVARRSHTESLEDPPRLRMDVSFTVNDFRPDIYQSGPINWIARNPTNFAEVFVSSLTGGLWKTTDGGNEWVPVRTLRPLKVSAVAYLFDGTPRGAILVTTQEDYRLDTDAGVWRSDNHGSSWIQVGHVPAGCPGLPRAYGIAVQKTSAWAATSCGLLRTFAGERTFHPVPDRNFPPGVFTDPACGAYCKQFYSLAVSRDGHLLIGGLAGFFYGSFGTFTRATAPRGSRQFDDVGSMRHSFAVTPSLTHPNNVLTLSGDPGGHRMLISDDNGLSWERVLSVPPPSRGGGGLPFVRIFPRAPGSDDLFIYYGDTVQLLRAGPFAGGNLSRLATDASIRWDNIGVGSHPDPHDIDLVAPADLPISSHKILLATDGGLEICDFEPPRCNDAGKIGPNRGLTSIQVTNVKGQLIGSGPAAVRHLYFDTWHDDRWASPDDRIAWPTAHMAWSRIPGESATLEMERRVASTDDAQIASDYYLHYHHLYDDLLTNHLEPGSDGVSFRDASTSSSPPLLLKRGIFAQTAMTKTATGLFAAENVTPETMPGIRWIQETTFENCTAPGDCVPLSLSDPPVFAGYREPHKIDAVLYQPYSGKLAVVTGMVTGASGGSALGPATVRYAEMLWRTRPVRWGIVRTPGAGFSNIPVFGADPLFPFHVVLADIGNNKVMRSVDGAESWAPIDDLTNMLTKDSRLAATSPPVFQFKINGNQTLVSAVSFFPEDPNLVIVGTVENGLFFSQDRALTWRPIPNTQHITNVVSFYWRTANSVVVGSFGRGLFEIGMNYTLPRAVLDPICRSCLFEPVTGFARLDSPRIVHASAQLTPAPQAFDEAVLVLDGRINGVEVSQGRLRKLSLTLGGSEYRFGGPNSKFDFVTEEHTGFLGFKGLPVADQLRASGKVVKGLAFTNGRISHVIYGSEETPTPTPPALGPFSLPKATDPHLKDPYLRIVGPDMILGTTAGGQSFDLQGYIFQPNTPVELSVDRQAIRQVRTDAKGTFSAKLVAPSSLGPHEISARQLVGNRTIQASIGFGVINSEEKKREP